MDNLEALTIRTEDIVYCPLCGQKGKFIYQGLEDYLFKVPGKWNIKRCVNPECEFVWLDPRPIGDDMGKLYAEYHTHGPADLSTQGMTALRRFFLLLAACLGKSGKSAEFFVSSIKNILATFGPRRESAEASSMWLQEDVRGRLLDVGCGSGLFLKQMQDLGWEVVGVEPDPKAAQVASREYDLEIRQGDLHAAGFSDNAFDAVTLSHVIEHVSDPIGLLKECRRILKPGGKLVITTPNINSFGHLIFGQDWRGLEPPRHFHLFCKTSLSIIASIAGFHHFKIKTLVRMSSGIWMQSLKVKATRTGETGFYHKICGKAVETRLFNFIMYYLSSVANCGDEIVIIASK